MGEIDETKTFTLIIHNLSYPCKPQLFMLDFFEGMWYNRNQRKQYEFEGDKCDSDCYCG